MWKIVGKRNENMVDENRIAAELEIYSANLTCVTMVIDGNQKIASQVTYLLKPGV